MVKTSIFADFSKFLSSLCRFKAFQGNVSLRSVVWYDVVLYLVFFGFIYLLNSKYLVRPYSFLDIFFSIFLGFIAYFFLNYSFVYLFLVAFEGKRNRGFFESFFVYLATLLPFFVVLNVLRVLQNVFWASSLMRMFFNVLLFVGILYMLFNFVLNFSSYFKTTYSRVLASFLLTTIVFVIVLLVLVVLNYLSGLV